jgi:hypothetical protein
MYEKEAQKQNASVNHRVLTANGFTPLRASHWLQFQPIDNVVFDGACTDFPANRQMSSEEKVRLL